MWCGCPWTRPRSAPTTWKPWPTRSWRPIPSAGSAKTSAKARAETSTTPARNPSARASKSAAAATSACCARAPRRTDRLARYRPGPGRKREACPAVGDLASIVKAYDIRGVVPDQLDEGVAEAVGAAFAKLTGAATILTVHDMRASSAPLAAAFGRGAASQGADVLAAGLGSTDMLYFGSGDLGIPGAMITASHNPPKYNGIKLCRSGAKPVGEDTGLAELRDAAERGVPAPQGPAGTIASRDLLPGYATFLKSLVDLSGIRPLKVVADAGNGMAGHTV